MVAQTRLLHLQVYGQSQTCHDLIGSRRSSGRRRLQTWEGATSLELAKRPGACTITSLQRGLQTSWRLGGDALAATVDRALRSSRASRIVGVRTDGARSLFVVGMLSHSDERFMLQQLNKAST